MALAVIKAPMEFQSTRLREARPKATAILEAVRTFQSTRLREARRLSDGPAAGRRDVSIHAPA